MTTQISSTKILLDGLHGRILTTSDNIAWHIDLKEMFASATDADWEASFMKMPFDRLTEWSDNCYMKIDIAGRVLESKEYLESQIRLQARGITERIREFIQTKALTECVESIEQGKLPGDDLWLRDRIEKLLHIVAFARGNECCIDLRECGVPSWIIISP